jgi:hypothetical protein
MAASYPNQTNPGSFIPTTYLLDPAQVYQSNINNPQLQELIVRLYQTVNSVALSVNTRDAGYVQEEFVCGQIYYPNPANSSTTGTQPAGAEFRQVFRKVISFGALPNTATKSLAHGITTTAGFTFTRIYATASDTATPMYIPIPFSSSTAADIISLDVDGTNINITTASDKTAYTTTYVVLEYIKS